MVTGTRSETRSEYGWKAVGKAVGNTGGNAVGNAVGTRSECGRNRDRNRGRKHDERGKTQARHGVLYGRAHTGSRCKHKARGKRNRTRGAGERTDTGLKRGNAEKMKDGERG